MTDFRKKLTPAQYAVMREKGTEPPFSSPLNVLFDKGVYRCAACGADLFSGGAKFKTSCGWPGFDRAIENSVDLYDDFSHNMHRTEVVCHHCQSHLGHVFPDGPTATGLRFCINGIALDFKADNELSPP